MTEDRPAPAGPPRANPYVGLLPFGEDDVPWFFGRDREQRIIGANLRSSRLTLLYGASGVGKSSVLQAAVLPALRAVVAGDRTAREREDPAARAPVRFAVSMFALWRDAPLLGLTSAVAASVHEATGEPVAPWEPGTPLRETFAAWLGPVTTLLVVLDQFEELFLYHPRDDGPGTFAGEFVDVVNDPALRVNFLLSLREDGLAKLDRFQGRVPRLFDNYLRVEHLDLAAARRAIEGPRDEFNRRLAAGSAPATIDADVIDAVLGEVRTREGVVADPRAPEQEAPSAADEADRVETPLLQLVMQRLWEAAAAVQSPPHVRLATLRDELGGTERIVYRHLEDALAALSDEQRDLAIDVLRPLVSPTGTKIAWRAADLAYWAKRPVEHVEPILLELSSGERRILRSVTPPPEQADDAPRYEIFHDILAEPILEWCAEREAERERDRLARELEAAERERKDAEDRRRRERRNRAVRGVVVVLGVLVVALIVAVLAARDRGEVAESRALALGATSQLPIDPEFGLLLALAAVRRRDTLQAEQALRRAVVASRVRARLGPDAPRPCRACAGLAGTARGTGTAVGQLAIAPDGRSVAAIVGGRLRLWRPQTGDTPRPGVSVGEAYAVAFTPDAARLLVVGESATALMAPDGTNAKLLRDTATPGRGSATGFGGATSPDGRRVVTTGEGGAAVWDARGGARLALLALGSYAGAAFQDAETIMLEGTSGEVVTWRWRTELTPTALAASELEEGVQPLFASAAGFAVNRVGDERMRVVGRRATLRLATAAPGDPVTAVAISPDGSRIVTARESVAELWGSDRPLWRTRATLAGRLVHTDNVNSVAFSADSKLVGTASTDGTARVWESATGDLVADLRGHGAAVQAIAFNPRGRYVTTVGEDLTVRLWDLGLERTRRGKQSVAGLAAAASGSPLAVAFEDGALEIQDVVGAGTPSPNIVARPPGRAPSPPLTGLHPTGVAFAMREPALLVGYATPGGGNGSARLLGTDGRLRVEFDPRGGVTRVAVDARARVGAVVHGVDDGTRVELWTLAEARPVRPLWRLPVADSELASDVAVSPDGRRVLVTSVYGLARLFDAVTRKTVHTLAAGTAASPGAEAFYRAVFSPDGKTVAVAGSRDVRLWDAASGAERAFKLSGHTSVLRSVAYSADGRRIVTASADGTVRVWDAARGIALAVASRHAGRVNGAALLPGGWIVSGGDDRTVRAYPCESCASVDSLIDTGARQVTRDLAERDLVGLGG